MHMRMSKAKLVNRFPDEGIGNRVCLFKPAIDSPRLSHLSAFFVPFLAEESWNDFPWQVLHRKRVDTDLVLERTAYAENRRVWAFCERRKARMNGKLSILLLGTFVPYFFWYDYVVNAVLSLSTMHFIDRNAHPVAAMIRFDHRRHFHVPRREIIA